MAIHWALFRISASRYPAAAAPSQAPWQSPARRSCCRKSAPDHCTVASDRSPGRKPKARSRPSSTGYAGEVAVAHSARNRSSSAARESRRSAASSATACSSASGAIVAMLRSTALQRANSRASAERARGAAELMRGALAPPRDRLPARTPSSSAPARRRSRRTTACRLRSRVTPSRICWLARKAIVDQVVGEPPADGAAGASSSSCAPAPRATHRAAPAC